MGGGLMQLVAYGAQDIYLTGNPQITFFKVVYRRHTNFAVESIEQTYNGSAAAGHKISVTISRNGDLLSQVWLQTAANAVLTTDQAVSNIDFVEVEIGGQVVDKQYGHWMQLWIDLTHTSDQIALLDDCMASETHAAGDGASKSDSYVPLQFWFCRNPGLALPLIALQYHEVKLNVQFSGSAKGLGAGSSVALYCDYVFLDTDERRRFAQVSHEYLIEQVQYSNALAVKGTTAQHELRFNHPVKELVWTVHDVPAAAAITSAGNVLETTVGTVVSGNVNVAAESDITCGTALLQLNGHDRFKRREGKYFTKVQRYQHHSGSSDTTVREAIDSGDLVGSTVAGAAADIAATAVRANVFVPHVYSFALKPEEHQPSGTCNFSRIDNAVLNLEFTDDVVGGKLKVYAVNYNVLRIMSGMGGLAYSN